MTLYVNGAQDGQGPLSGKISNDGTSFRVGANHGADRASIDYFQGRIDEPAVYASALSPTDIAAINSASFMKCQ